MTPTTDSELYDKLQRMFGIGTWDALLAGENEPWWRARSQEIVKIAAKRKKLKVSVQELSDAADYCKAQGIVIHNAAWLYKHITAAKSFAAGERRALLAQEREGLIDEAIAYERTLADGSPWLEQLVRARGIHREEVYRSWKEHRQPSQSRTA